MDSASAVIVGAMTGNKVTVNGGDFSNGTVAGARAVGLKSNVNENEVVINYRTFMAVLP